MNPQLALLWNCFWLPKATLSHPQRPLLPQNSHSTLLYFCGLTFLEIYTFGRFFRLFGNLHFRKIFADWSQKSWWHPRFLEILFAQTRQVFPQEPKFKKCQHIFRGPLVDDALATSERGGLGAAPWINRQSVLAHNIPKSCCLGSRAGAQL